MAEHKYPAGLDGYVFQLGDYLEFRRDAEAEAARKTAVWNVHAISNGARLGTIKWYSPWRQYCFFPDYGSVFNTSCMMSIQSVLSGLKLKRENLRA